MVRIIALLFVLTALAGAFYLSPSARFASRAQVVNTRNALANFNTARQVRSYASIRDVDFRNYAYPPCDGPDVRLRNGKDQYGHTIYDLAELASVRYVDFDGDRNLEAFVTIDWSTSGTAGGGVNAYVFALDNRTPRLIWSRCSAKASAKLVGKSIVFGYAEYVGDDPNCCPTYSTTDTIAWRGRRFVRIAKRRERN